MVSELLTGALIGLLGRAFFIALETIGMAIAMAIGLSSNLGAPVNEDEPLPAITTLLTLGGHRADVPHRPAPRDLPGASRRATRPCRSQGGFSSQFALAQLASKVGARLRRSRCASAARS